MRDIEIHCIGGCKRTFTFTIEEQEYLNKLHADGKIGVVCEPKRCKECRYEKKRADFERNNPPKKSLADKYPYLRKSSMIFEGDEELINELNNTK